VGGSEINEYIGTIEIRLWLNKTPYIYPC